MSADYQTFDLFIRYRNGKTERTTIKARDLRQAQNKAHKQYRRLGADTIQTRPRVEETS